MIKFRQHVPGYFDGVRPVVIEADDQAALLAHPRIASYTRGDLVIRNGEVREKPFYRFSMADDNTLLVEYDEGHSWWVLGFILDGRDQITLPLWVMHPDAQKRIDAWNTGNTSYDDGRFQRWPLFERTP